MTHRDWTDPRDGKQFTAEVLSDTPLADLTDNELEALLDRARG